MSISISSLRRLGPDIVQAMEQDYPAMLSKDQNAIREFLSPTKQPTWEDVEKAMPALQRWINGRPALKKEVLAQPGHFVATCIAPLMVWALGKPWPRDMNTQSMLHTWQLVASSSFSSSAKVRHGAVCAHLLAPLLPLLPPKLQAQVCSHAFSTLAGSVSEDYTWSTETFEIEHITQFLVGLGHFASEKKEHGLTWAIRWQNSWYRMDPKEQNAAAIHVLQSTLPSELKLRALAVGTSELWRTGAVHFHLQSVLPSEEFERAQLLPFTRTLAMKGAAPSHSAEIQRLTSIESNKELLRAYCPQMYTHFDMLARDEDWLSPETLKAWALRFKPGPAPETLALPEQYTI